MTIDAPESAVDAEKRKLVRHLDTFDANIRYPAPYVGFAGRPSSQIFEHGWHYDALGYRNDVAIGPRGPGETLRVLIVGDSTMVDGVTVSDTVPGRVQATLRARFGSGAHVYNFGAISSGLNQMIMLVTTKLIDMEADAVVILAGGTDIFQPWTFDPRPGYPYNMFAIEGIYDELFSQSRTRGALDDLSQAAMQDLIFTRLHNLRAVTRWKDPAWEWEVVRHFELAVDRIGRLAKGIGIPIHLVLQPMVVRKAQLSDTEQTFASSEFLSYLDRQYERIKTVVGGYHDKFGARASFHAHDLSDLFFKTEQPIFTDIVHYNDVGRQMMAEAVTGCLDLPATG